MAATDSTEALRAELAAARAENEVLLQQLKEQREKHRGELGKKDEAMKAYQEQFTSEIVKLQSSMQQGIQACYGQITSLKEQLQSAREENRKLKEQQGH